MGLNLPYREFLAILTSSIYHIPATMELCAADTDVRVIIRNLTVRMNSTVFGVVSSLEAMRIQSLLSENCRKIIETRVENTQSNFPWRLRHEQ